MECVQHGQSNRDLSTAQGGTEGVEQMTEEDGLFSTRSTSSLEISHLKYMLQVAVFGTSRGMRRLGILTHDKNTNHMVSERLEEYS